MVVPYFALQLSKLQGAPDKNKKEVENLEKKKAEFEVHLYTYLWSDSYKLTF